MKKHTLFISLIDAETKTPLSVVSTYKTLQDIVSNNGATCSIFESDNIINNNGNLVVKTMLKIVLYGVTNDNLNDIIDTLECALDPEDIILQTNNTLVELKKL